ncbi:aspartate kinase [Natronobacillus azotifigens]|uniref:Aspartokinase n=1 Tax=Natronobacillus azotifigens TaxID=472978 RepID=A0A9J6RAD5_9BACI|nr:aspartate kinase [Natronobacillus azotifigens]MCZ0702616.1 aspartate kinase [Natronobacillus azotifigens]
MEILVQKFGGTSVQNKETRSHAIKHIQAATREGYKVVVVVSAMGRAPEPYATDSLLSLVDYPDGYSTKREQDLLLSCGEVISAVVFSNELKENKIQSTALTGAQAGFITNEEYTAAKIKKMQVDRVFEELQVNDVVVVAGFQGKSERSGEITTLGRGGSDTSAAALGAALDAKYVDIFTDVDGIMTADPRIVKSARTLDVVTYHEICNLAYQGAKVIHPRAVEIAMQAKIPIRVRSTSSTNLGTLVTSTTIEEKGKDIPDRLITGIAHMSGITQVKVEAEDQIDQLHAEVFKLMAEAGISVDFINIFPNGVIYTIPEVFSEKAKLLLEELSYQPKMIHHCAKVSLVGAGMTGVPGVTAKIVQTLTDAGIQILQSADSHTTIWVLISHDDLVPAINALHDTFELNGKNNHTI